MVVYTGGQLLWSTRIKKVVVQDGVREIANSAFEKCPKIRSITIPNSVTSIGYCAFSGLGDLETISIPNSVNKIGKGAFYKCTSLKAIVVPEGMTEIEGDTFCRCSSLENITFPKSLTKIGDGAFDGCTALEQVDIPHGVTVVPYCAFEGCTSLHTVTLPPTIEIIFINVFRGCDNLNNFIIPNGLPALKDGFNPFDAQLMSWELIMQILAQASNLTRMSLRNRYTDIADHHLPKVLELVSACPTLREIDLSRNYLSVGLFEKLASQEIPGQLRLLEIKGRCDVEYYNEIASQFGMEEEDNEEGRRQWEERRRQWEETSSSPEYLLLLLERNPKLVIKTDKFWDDSDDDKVCHHLDMNEYGCRGFTVRDSHWPELIETLPQLEEEGAVETAPYYIILKKKRERHRRAANILYSLFHLQLDVLLNYQQRHNSGSDNNLATAPPLDNVDTIIHRLRDRLEQQKLEIKEKDDEIKEKDAMIKGKDATIKAGDKKIKAKDATIKAKDAKIKVKDKEIKEKDNEIRILGRLLEQGNSTPYANEKTTGRKRTRLK